MTAPRSSDSSACVRLAVVLVLAFAMAACQDLSFFGPPPDRPDDGLVFRPELQRAVDLQVDRDVGGLLALLDAAEEDVRARAAFALASVQSPGAASALADALDDESWRVRRDAAFALGRTPGVARSGQALWEALAEERKRDVRRALVVALGHVGEPEQIDSLVTVDDRALRAEVTRSLGRALIRGYADTGVIERLASGLSHRDRGVRTASAYAFARSDSPTVWRGAESELARALEGADPDDPEARYLMQAGSKAGVAGLAEPAVRWLEEASDWRTRVVAAQTLAALDPPAESVTDALFEALEDPSVHVRVSAAEAVASRPFSTELARRAGDWVRRHMDDWRAAAPLFPVIGEADRPAAVGLAEEVYTEGAPARRLAGIDVLGAVSGPEALPALTRAALDDAPVVGRAGVAALIRAWREARDRAESAEPYWNALAEAARSPDAAVAGRAVQALFDRGFEAYDPAPVVAAAYDAAGEGADPELLAELVRPLGRRVDQAPVPLLRRALTHPDARVSGAAAQALSQILKEPVSPPDPPAGAPAAGEESRLPAHLGDHIDWAALSGLGPHPVLTLETPEGRIRIELDAEEAPMTVEAIATIANAGMYDGVPFHRVVPNFVAQGGDVSRQSGSGGPGFRIRTELTTIPFVRGVIGMASSGKDTEGSQFFVTHSIQPHLDGSYTAFGRVTDGIEVLDGVGRWTPVIRARVEPAR